MDDHTLHLRPPLWLPILVALVAGGCYMGGKYIEKQDLTPLTISVQGEGKVQSSPNIAEMSFGVKTGRQKNAEAAMNILSSKMDAVLAAITETGVEGKDIRTEQLSLQPAYDWDDGQRIDRGFEASQSLRVRIRDLSSIAKVLGAATAAGANQAGNVSFTIDDPEELKSQARAKAIDSARARAEQLAEELGMTLGKMRSYNEGGYDIPVAYARSMIAEDAGYGGGGPVSPPVPAGEQEVRVNVNVSYELR